MVINQLYLTKKGEDSYIEVESPLLSVSGNNFGIGKNDPSHTLDVIGDFNLVGDLSSSGVNVEFNYSNVNFLSNSINLGYGQSSVDGGGLRLGGHNILWSETDSSWIVGDGLKITGENALHISNVQSDGDIEISSNNSSSLFLSSQAKVGVLNDSPNYELDVSGSGNFSETLYVQGSPVLTGTRDEYVYWEKGNSNIYYNQGNVGIGAESIDQKLYVSGDATVEGDFRVVGESGVFDVNSLQVSGSSIILNYLDQDLENSNGGISLNYNGDPKSIYYIADDNEWRVYDNLQVVGSGNFDQGLFVDGNPVLTGIDGLVAGKWSDDGANDIYYNQGKVGINNDSPQFDLDVSGSGNFDTLYVEGNPVLTGIESLGNYYTAGEVQLFLDEKSNTGHLHDDRYYSRAEIDAQTYWSLSNNILSSDSSINVNSSGNFASGLFVSGVPVLTGLSSLDGFSLQDHRHDDLYSPTGHAHNDLYYQKSQVDSIVQSVAVGEHNHDDRYYTEDEIDLIVTNINQGQGSWTSTAEGGIFYIGKVGVNSSISEFDFNVRGSGNFESGLYVDGEPVMTGVGEFVPILNQNSIHLAGSGNFGGGLFVDGSPVLTQAASVDHNHDGLYVSLVNGNSVDLAGSGNFNDGLFVSGVPVLTGTEGFVNNFALVNHDHDGVYAFQEHNHDDYAGINHNHDSNYAPIEHAHDDKYLQSSELNNLYHIFDNQYDKVNFDGANNYRKNSNGFTLEGIGSGPFSSEPKIIKSLNSKVILSYTEDDQKIRVYKFENESWSKLGQDISYTADFDDSLLEEPISISDNGEYILLNENGLIKKYSYDGSNWVPENVLDLSSESNPIKIRCSISNDGSYVTISHTNKTKIYRYTEDQWMFVNYDFGGYINVNVTVSGGLFLFDGATTFDMVEGYNYQFDYPSSHPLAFSTTNNGTHGGGTEYTSGVTRSGNTLSVNLSPDSPATLYSYCTAHSGMGRTHAVEDFYVTIPENSLNRQCSAKISENKKFLVVFCPDFAGSFSKRYGLLSVFKIDDLGTVSQFGSTLNGDSYNDVKFGQFGVHVSDSSNTLFIESGTITQGQQFIHFFKINEDSASGSLDEINISDYGLELDQASNSYTANLDLTEFYHLDGISNTNNHTLNVYSIGTTNLSVIRSIDIYNDFSIDLLELVYFSDDVFSYLAGDTLISWHKSDKISINKNTAAEYELDVVGSGNFSDGLYVSGNPVMTGFGGAGDFATIDHNHDEVYSQIGHDHDSSYSLIGHNHDDLYSSVNHNHDGIYLTLDGLTSSANWSSKSDYFGQISATANPGDGDILKYIGGAWTPTPETSEELFQEIIVTAAGGMFYIDGQPQLTVVLTRGTTYRFNQSDSSNISHPLRFSTDADGTEYTEGVSVVGALGGAGAYTQIIVEQDTPTLYYYCASHSGMGGKVLIGSAWQPDGENVSILNGNVGFGKENPTEKIDVAGNVKIDGSLFLKDNVTESYESVGGYSDFLAGFTD
jgi:hypothetical protein